MRCYQAFICRGLKPSPCTCKCQGHCAWYVRAVLDIFPYLLVSDDEVLLITMLEICYWIVVAFIFRISTTSSTLACLYWTQLLVTTHSMLTGSLLYLSAGELDAEPRRCICQKCLLPLLSSSLSSLTLASQNRLVCLRCRTSFTICISTLCIGCICW